MCSQLSRELFSVFFELRHHLSRTINDICLGFHQKLRVFEPLIRVWDTENWNRETRNRRKKKVKMISRRKTFFFTLFSVISAGIVAESRMVLGRFSELSNTLKPQMWWMSCGDDILNTIMGFFPEDESCELHNGQQGRCVYTKDCDWLAKKLVSGEISYSQIITCSFDVRIAFLKFIIFFFFCLQLRWVS